jgi:hypothetical protein
MQAILSHPLAYAAHRLDHWNIATQFMTRTIGERWIISASDPNDWGFRVAPNPVNRFVTAAVWAVNATPLGWPCWWVALSFGLVVLGRRSPPVLALAGSAFLYSLGYAVFSVASELRYYCWPMMACLIAAVMFARHWRDMPADLRPGWMGQVMAITPLLLVTVLGLSWRWLA